MALILLGSAYAVVLQLNTLTIQLAWVGLGLACIYPLSKRFIKAPQLVLGSFLGAFQWHLVLKPAILHYYVGGCFCILLLADCI